MKKILFLLSLMIATVNCGQLVKESQTEYNSITLDCETKKNVCPSQKMVQKMVYKFSECINFDPQQSLYVHWYDPDKIWIFPIPGTNDTITAVGYSSEQTNKDVYVSSENVFFHELMHIKMYRDYGDLDSDHEQGEGPWYKEHNLLIRLAEISWANNEPCTL